MQHDFEQLRFGLVRWTVGERRVQLPAAAEQLLFLFLRSGRSVNSAEIFTTMWQKWYVRDAVRRRGSEQACMLRRSADTAGLLCCVHGAVFVKQFSVLYHVSVFVMSHPLFSFNAVLMDLVHPIVPAEQCKLGQVSPRVNTGNSFFFLCARFLLQCLSFHKGQCFCPRSQSKRGTSTNSRRRDRNCCPALLLRNATSGWRVRRWPMPKALTGRLVLTDDSALILSLTDRRQRFVTYVLYSSSPK